MIDSSSNLVVGTATVGDFPNHILAAAADRVYVTDAGSNDLAVVDPMTWTVTLHPIDAPGTYSGSCPSHGGSCPAGLTLVGPVLYVVLSGRNVLGIIGESAPVVDGVTISPSAPRTNDTLTATVLAHDADGDPLTYTYQWTKNGSDIAGATALTLDLSVSGNGSRGDSMAVRVIASDGSLTSAPVTSTAVVIANSAPVATVALNTTAPTTQTVLVATATASDADGDALTFTYVWKVNGVVRRTTVTASTTDSFDLGRPGNGNKGDLVTVELTAFDGALSSSTATADVTIGRGR
jgi:hypothetical protein